MGAVGKVIEQGTVQDLPQGLCTQREREHIGHDLAHQMLGRARLYDRNRVGGKECTAQRADAEHRQQDGVTANGTDREQKGDTAREQAQAEGDENCP